MWKEVYIRSNSETGVWLYTLANANRTISNVTLANGDIKVVDVRQRAKDSEGKYLNDPAQGAYKYHYVLLDDEYTGCDKSELINDGWTEKAELNVETGDFRLVEA